MVNMKKDQFLKNKEKLKKLIEDEGLIKDGNFTLASKLKSTFYFNIKKVSMFKVGKQYIGNCINEIIKNDKFDSVGGMESGAIPIIDAVVEHSNIERGFYVKKEVKAHGTQKAIDGCFYLNDIVLMVEDVTTTGNSVLKACKIVENAGGKIKRIITVVDRLQGAREKIIDEGYLMVPIFTKNDFEI